MVSPRRILVLTAGALTFGASAAAVAVGDGGPAPGVVSATGTPVAASKELRGALALDDLAAYRPDPSTAQRIDGSGEPWTLVRGASGAACVDVGDLTVTCASADEIAAGRLGITTIAPPPADVELQLAAARRAAVETGASSSGAAPVVRGAAVRRGIVPDGTTEVRAVAADGRVVARTPVRGNAYRVAMGVEGEATALVLARADGTATTASLR